MENQKLTIKEALAAGYTHVCEEGDNSLCKIEDYEFNEDKSARPMLMSPTEKFFYTINADEIEQLIVDKITDQDEVYDPKDKLLYAMEKVDNALYQQLVEALNKAWSEIGFIVPTEIELVP